MVKQAPRLMAFIEKMEKLVVIALIVMIAVILAITILELALELIIYLSSPPIPFVGLDNLLNIFGVFLLVLIGIELLWTVKSYLQEEIVHVEVVMIVAIIAIARKIIVTDFRTFDGVTIIGIGIIIIALSAGYFLLRKSGVSNIGRNS
ncbi:MAG: phosphate-starvation-inducible PsiE family protein [Thermoplasmata archaeon]